MLGAGAFLFRTLPPCVQIRAPREAGMNTAPRRKRLAIIGAGPAGLAAAWRLRHVADIDVTVFEKSRGVFGRAATRTRHGARLDPGANYFRTDLPDIARMVHSELPSGELVEIAGDIDVFDRFGAISAGNPSLNGEKKWTYRDGINTLGKLLAEAAQCKIVFGTRVDRIRRNSRALLWEVIDEAKREYGLFDAILLALPAPQAIALLPEGASTAARALAPATYHSQWSFTFAFDGHVNRWPGGAYALINNDRQHDFAWVSRENAKPGRIPEGMLVVMAQMQPGWSLDRFHHDAGELARVVSKTLADFFGWNNAAFQWFDSQRWKYSLPAGRADPDQLQVMEATGLYVAGDAVVGKGRVAQALQTGLDAAERILGSA